MSAMNGGTTGIDVPDSQDVRRHLTTIPMMDMFPRTLKIIRIMAEEEDEATTEAVEEQPELKEEKEEEVRFPMLELLKSRH